MPTNWAPPMDTDYRKRRQWLFDEAAELPPDRQADFLVRECGSDAALRQEIESLLRHDAAVGDVFLKNPLRCPNRDPPYSETLPDVPPPSPQSLNGWEHPQHIGHYELLGVLGEGGMGAVYEARQENPRRTVALKMVRPGYLSAGLRKRLQHEALILGQLQHPNVAQIYEAGTATVGEGPRSVELGFIAMELVRGESLIAYCKHHELGVRDRMELMVEVCDAVHYAHAQGIIHRDLKPSNILVTEAGCPKILDFGVASATNSDLDAMTLLTEAGQLVGTIAYMSPEQVVGDSAQIDARSDVYSLGVTMFELLAGRLPYDVHGLPVPEAARVIREEEPSHLSSVNSILRGDIETIVAKALEKERERRYQSARELSADIRRYLRDEPIIARPASSFYQLRKFAKRNKIFVGGVAATMASLMLGLIGMTWFAASEAKQHRLADASEQKAQRNLELAERRSYRESIHAAETALEKRDATCARMDLDNAIESLRGWEWHHFRSRLDNSLLNFQTSLPLQPGDLVHMDLGITSDGGTLCLLSWQGDIPPPRWHLETFDLRGQTPLLTQRMLLTGYPRLTSDAGHVVFQGPDRAWQALNTQTGETRRVDVAGSAQVAGGQPYALHPEPLRVLETPGDTPYIVEPTTATRRALPDSRMPANWWRSAFSADATLLAYPVGQLEQTEILVWDAVRATLLHTFSGYPEEVYRVAFSPDNSRLAAVSGDGTLRQWDLATGALSDWPTPARHNHRTVALAYSPDGRLIATSSQDRTVRLWDADTGQSADVYVGHQAEIASVAFSPHGARLASASSDGEIRVWDVTHGADPHVFVGHTLYVYAVALSPDAARLASASWDGTVRIWDVDSGDQVAVIPVSPASRVAIHSMDYHPNDSQIAVLERDLEPPKEARVRILNASTGASRVVFRSTNAESRMSMAYYPTGSRLVVSGAEKENTVVFETDNYTPVARVPGVGACAVSLAGEPRLATVTEDNRILLYDADTFEPLGELAGHDRPIWSMAFSPDGRLLASCSEDQTVRVWDVTRGTQLAVLRGHTDRVLAFAFSPDGTRIASGSDDRTIRLWDTQFFEEVGQLDGHGAYVISLVFSPDGRRLFSGSGDYTVRVWELDPLRVRLAARYARARIVAEFQPEIQSLFDVYNDPNVVVERIKSNAAYDSRQREVALQLTLTEAVNRHHPAQ